MIKHTIHKPLLIKWWMNIFDYDGLATFWDTIYYKDIKAMNDKRLVKHELKHIEQMQRDGKLKYFFKYNWFWIRYGYQNNPYEIEARNAECIKL